MTYDDRRLIEDYLPIQAISAEASREKSVRKGHISTLHLWWARRPLVACRAAVYGALVSASRFIPALSESVEGEESGSVKSEESGRVEGESVKSGSVGAKNQTLSPSNAQTLQRFHALGRANAAKFFERLCKYPGNPTVIKDAQRHILEAHAERLTVERGERVSVEDIESGKAPRPKVLDMFAGGGAIPLEALRLGCEAYALDLNPVAHIIELCTLVYPQKYGKPDPNARGMTGPFLSGRVREWESERVEGESVKSKSVGAKNKTLSPSNAQTLQRTWGGLADEVRYWGEWVLKKVKAEIGDLYPPIVLKSEREERANVQTEMFASDTSPSHTSTLPHSHTLTPVAYYWTRTIPCPNPQCKGTVPLYRQTWLRNKSSGYVALKPVPDMARRIMRFQVVEARSASALGFDPSTGSAGSPRHVPSVKQRSMAPMSAGMATRKALASSSCV